MEETVSTFTLTDYVNLEALQNTQQSVLAVMGLVVIGFACWAIFKRSAK